MMKDAHELADRISKLDLNPIKFKLRESEGYSDQEIAVIDKWYRRFLLLATTHPEKAVVVPDPIDDMWHHHILDTRKYEADCKEVFGQFLHHFPYFGLRSEDDALALRAAYEETNSLMQSEFGETAADELGQLRKEWAEAQAASSCSDCTAIWARGASAIPQAETRPGFVTR
jgi:hypothetical protein